MYQQQLLFMEQLDIQLVFKVDIQLEFKENILQELHMLLDLLPMLLEDKPLPMLLETVELEEKMSTKHLKLEVMLLEEVELDNIDFYIF